MVITADFFAEKRVFCGADHRQPRRGATRAPGPWIHRGPAWSIVEGEHAGRHHDRGRPGRSSPRPSTACSSRAIASSTRAAPPRPAWSTVSTWSSSAPIVEGEHAGRHHDRGRPGRPSPRPSRVCSSRAIASSTRAASPRPCKVCSSRRARAKHPVNQPRYLLAVREQGPRKPAAEPAAGPRPEGPATAVAVEPPPLPKTCGILSGLVHTVPATRPPEIFPPPRGGASSTRARAASPRAVGLVIVEGEHAGRHHDRGRGPEGIRRFCHRNRLVDRPPRPAWSIDNRGRRGHAAPGVPGQRHRDRPGRLSRRGAAVTTGPQIRTVALPAWSTTAAAVEGMQLQACPAASPRPAWSTVSTWSRSAPIVEGEHTGRHHRPADPHRRVAGLVDHRRGRRGYAAPGVPGSVTVGRGPGHRRGPRRGATRHHRPADPHRRVVANWRHSRHAAPGQKHFPGNEAPRGVGPSWLQTSLGTAWS